jgi:predicted ester cyclase
MTAEQVVRELVDRVWNGGQIDDLPRYFADPFDHGGNPDTVAGLREWHRADAAAWADTAYDVVSLVSDGEQVALRWRATARHVGVWGPVPPTGKTISWDGVHFFRVRDGRVEAMWAMADVFAKAMQLGATVTPPQA